MDAIVDKHVGLIRGLTKLFDLLVKMRYISPEHVMRPPHVQEILATDVFSDIGLSSEVVNLIKVIPALRSDITWGWQREGIELLPQSKAVTYFADYGDKAWMEDLRWGDWYKTSDDSHRLLPPEMLRLTNGNLHSWARMDGMDLIYNTVDGNIIEWSRLERVLWDQSPSRPAEIVLQEILKKFETLEWIPYFDPADESPPQRTILEDPLVLQNRFPRGIRLPPDHHAAILTQEATAGTDRMSSEIYKWRFWNRLYRDCGWGGESFDGEEFERKRVGFIEALKSMKEQYPPLGHQYHNAEQGPAQWREFWRVWAGEEYIGI